MRREREGYMKGWGDPGCRGGGLVKILYIGTNQQLIFFLEGERHPKDGKEVLAIGTNSWKCFIFPVQGQGGAEGSEKTWQDIS